MVVVWKSVTESAAPHRVHELTKNEVGESSVSLAVDRNTVTVERIVSHAFSV